MQIYLNKNKVLALLMMIDTVEGYFSGSADGWYDLNNINPEFYDEVSGAVHEMKEQLKLNGFDFKTNVRPILNN